MRGIAVENRQVGIVSFPVSRLSGDIGGVISRVFRLNPNTSITDLGSSIPLDIGKRPLTSLVSLSHR